jgi:hypothetical protein
MPAPWDADVKADDVAITDSPPQQHRRGSRHRSLSEVDADRGIALGARMRSGSSHL